VESDWGMLLCGGFFALFFGGVGVMLLVIRHREQKKAKESESWPIAKGTVTNAYLGVMDDSGAPYFPVVEYTYAVGDQVFQGNRIYFGPVIYQKFSQPVEELLAHYEIGSEVKVYYNPQKPKEAVLMCRLSKPKLGLIVPIILLIAAGLILLLMAAVSIWTVLSV